MNRANVTIELTPEVAYLRPLDTPDAYIALKWPDYPDAFPNYLRQIAPVVADDDGRLHGVDIQRLRQVEEGQ